ncbi:MAG TPA: 3-dehydroquinate synthase [Pyrinomonadaceae bacterium]
MQRLRVRTKTLSSQYEIRIERNRLTEVGKYARAWLGKETKRVALISNPRVFSLYGGSAIRSLKTNKFLVSEWVSGDGERFKSLSSTQKLLTFLSDAGFERTDVILALGGGVIGDLAGFAASIYLRGIRFVYVPTTLLAQIDASIGGKTGVNLPQGKNLVGTFHQPSGVLADLETLKTLTEREITSGCCEIVKQGAVADRKLFDQTASFLKALNSINDLPASAQLEKLIAAHCSFKASIVSNDERETTARTDNHSRKILNFGHTSAHALEALTQYRRFRHGEAVGVGMVIAGQLSKNLGMLSANELESLVEAVHSCGRLPHSNDLEPKDVLNFITRDKKSIAGNVQWILLEGIGRPRIVSNQEIPPKVLVQSIHEGLQRASTLRTLR